MKKVIFKADVMVAGSPRKIGDVLEISDGDYRILKGYKFVEDYVGSEEKIETKPIVKMTKGRR
ncbi:MAG: hypothetical protein WC623_24495 [Pedobacter sp.]|uniref:hypothetical protein n=1 Tax=Pedobacter sp. TaxID=1411316 RepID=UPI003564B7DB